jgi:hypothetical protein
MVIAAVAGLSACSPQSILAGLANNVAGPQLYETIMTTTQQSYVAQGMPATRVSCIMTKIREQVKPADLTNLQVSPDGKLTNATSNEKLTAARKAAEAACPQ